MQNRTINILFTNVSKSPSYFPIKALVRVTGVLGYNHIPVQLAGSEMTSEFKGAQLVITGNPA